MSYSFIRKHPKFDGIHTKKNPTGYLTVNLDRNRKVYDERLIDVRNIQYRTWNPYRSKLCAAIHNNVRKIFLSRTSRVLYLGASSGTTVSHFSDIATEGIIYAVEFSARSLRELVQNCVDRANVIPILGDANHPYEYSPFISEPVDLIYMDVAQPNQTEILIDNAQRLLKDRGNFIYCIKSRSIDTTKSPTAIFKEQVGLLKSKGFRVAEEINIAPYSEDHVVLFGQYSKPNQ